LAPYWLFVLGGMFIISTLFLPKGIVGTAVELWQRVRRSGRPKEASASAPLTGTRPEAAE
ncbi:MAG: urea ABC transporter permease subunit UrtC, partial [Pseudomonadota bacterium]